jgi:hypothetical protein
MSAGKGHSFPPDMIRYAAWLYYRFNRSHRVIESSSHRVIESSKIRSANRSRHQCQLRRDPSLVHEFGAIYILPVLMTSLPDRALMSSDELGEVS